MNPVSASSSSILLAFRQGGSVIHRFRILHQYFTALICYRIIDAKSCFTIYCRRGCFALIFFYFINCICFLSRSITLSPVYPISLPYFHMGSICQSKILNAMEGDNLPTTGRDCSCREKMLYELGKQDERTFLSIKLGHLVLYTTPRYLFFSAFFITSSP